MPLDVDINIVRPDDVILELGTIPEAKYTLIEALVNAASARIERACNTFFKPRRMVRHLEGDAFPNLDVGGHIQEVFTVTLNGSGLTPEVDYYAINDQGLLYRYQGWAPSAFTSPLNVVVDATLGRGSIPHEVTLACKELVKFWYASGQKDPALKSEKIEEYAYERFVLTSQPGTNEGDIPPHVLGMIMPYKRWKF